jgi:AcrR family transcriptional regulator
MTEREISIIEAAIRIILRYGMARTTMNDVAKEASTSRQTLYASFSGKQELLRATIRYLAERNAANIDSESAKASSLDQQLDIVIRYTAVNSFDLLHASPDADDIVNGFNAACKEELIEASERFRVIIESILSPYRDKIEASGMGVAQLADFVQRSTLTLKHEAQSKTHLLTLAQSLKTLVLTLTGCQSH